MSIVAHDAMLVRQPVDLLCELGEIPARILQVGRSASPSGATVSMGNSPMNFNVTCMSVAGIHVALGAPLAMRKRSATRATRRRLGGSRSMATNARIVSRGWWVMILHPSPTSAARLTRSGARDAQSSRTICSPA
jgi:hypothetical protein